MLVYILGGLVILLTAWNIFITVDRHETCHEHVILATKLEQFLDAEAQQREVEAEWAQQEREYIQRQEAEWERMMQAPRPAPVNPFPNTPLLSPMQRTK